MTTAAVPRGRRSSVDKHDERRAQLAASALETLGERGYARTSLREIAQNSPFSHGVVHYYFDSKVALIIHGVREYKQVCVTRYDDVIEQSSTGAELVARFADRLVETLCEDTYMHRLWYDLRTQSMFDVELRADILDIDHTLQGMVARVLSRYAELDGRTPAYDEPTAYALLDGLFERAVVDHLAGDAGAAEALRARATAVVPTLLR